ncbi:MAG: hypothetical protein ACUVXJ_19125 [Phycisphaerae bacterium]
MTAKPLTGQQLNVLRFVEDFLRDRGFPPTLREIATALGLASINAVRGHLTALERKGYIVRDAEKARSIRVVHSPSALSRVKRKLHEVFGTDENVFHRIVYGLAWTTKNCRPWLQGPMVESVREALDRAAVEHGWTILDRRIDPDLVVVVVATWPNHSALQTVRRFQSICLNTPSRGAVIRDRRRWGKGFVATTDLEMLNVLVDRLVRNSRRRT